MKDLGTMAEIIKKYTRVMGLLPEPVLVAKKDGLNKEEFLKACDSMWDACPYKNEG